MKGHPIALIAVAAAVLSSILGGSAIVATRFVVPEAGVLVTILLRFAGAGLVMLAFTVPRMRVRIALHDLPVVVGLGFIMFAVFPFFFTMSLAHIPAARGALVLSTQPLMTLTLAALLGRERFTLMNVSGGVLALLAVGFALGDRIGTHDAAAWKGDLYMFAAAFSGAVYNVFASLALRKYRALVASSVMIPVGTVAIGVLILIRGDWGGLAEISMPGWIAVAYLMSIGGALPFFLWIWALEHTSPSRVSLAVTFNPVSAVVFGAIVLSEPVTWRLLVGLVGVIAALVLANWSMLRRRPVVPPPGR
ncbi:MAG: DMT family transporter [Burkholderiales bacterium]|nr:DMT family transporter [Burkholderiales bacterium]